LGFHPEVPASFFKGHIHMPAQDKPLDNLRRREREVGTEEGTWWHVPLWIDHEHPTGSSAKLTL